MISLVVELVHSDPKLKSVLHSFETELQAAYVLQGRGCKPKIQKSPLRALDVILGTPLVGSLEVALLPNKPDCHQA